jgi:Tat protein translocase TatB subunit
MPSLGPFEILTVLVVALLVFGPARLPEIARKVGNAVAELRRAADDLRDEFQTGFDEDEDEEPAAPRTDEVHTDDEVEVIADRSSDTTSKDPGPAS